jgi:acyl-coenzyme A synthetase/AMP-(fatty) acid ligase
VLGLVGGLLNCLHTGAELVVPRNVGVAGILRCLTETKQRAVLLGVPSQMGLLARVSHPLSLPRLEQIITGGELLREDLREDLVKRYRVRVGTMYGMTEAGVIATDLSGALRPRLQLAPGQRMRSHGGALLLHRPVNPYLGGTGANRWSKGWLRTGDAGQVNPDTGQVTVSGRLDAQVSIGGQKVDLHEVEDLLVGAPGVCDAVVVYDGAICAYTVLSDPDALSQVEAYARERLASYARPRAVRVVPSIPRTATGKPVRSARALAELYHSVGRS